MGGSRRGRNRGAEWDRGAGDLGGLAQRETRVQLLGPWVVPQAGGSLVPYVALKRKHKNIVLNSMTTFLFPTQTL